MKKFFPIAFAAALAMTLTAFAGPSSAAYPVNTCVAKKMGAAGKFCSAVLGAWSKNADDSGARDAAITKAATKLDGSWTKSETSAAKKNVDCADTTASSADIRVSIETAAAALAATVLDGVDTGDKFDTGCRAKINKVAAKFCQGLLKAEGKHIKALVKDKDGTALAAAVAKAEAKFTKLYDKSVAKALGKGVTCPSTTDGSAIQTEAAALSDEVVTDTTVSPNVSTDWTSISVPVANVEYPAKYPKAITTLFPTCSRLTPYMFFVKKGTTNNLVMYYQGGGACWDGLSCNQLGIFGDTASEADSPALISTGFADADNPDNPFKDWNQVFVTYCTGDVHWGDAFGAYSGGGIYHYGRHNASLAEKWAREHFVNPDRVFVTGSSAGSYGAVMNSVPLMESVYPASRFDVIGDGGNGVITPEWQANYFPNWGVANTRPDHIPGLDAPLETTSMAETMIGIANYFPNNRFANYTTAYDGSGGGQCAFYQVMLNPGDPFQWSSWWEPTCAWNSQMKAMSEQISTAASNYRYYIGAGSRHTGWGSDKVYTDTSGGVPTLVDWVNDMMDDEPSWVDVECTDCSLIATCQGGDTPGGPCTVDGDCGAGGSCDDDPVPGSLPAGPYLGGGVVDCP